MANEQENISASEKKKEDWMNSKWRPMMGWMYMVVCTMDMVVFPILWSLLQTFTGTQITQWNPLTLQGAGLFHIAMGAVLGIAAFGRTQEKLNGANNGGIQTPTPTPTGSPGAPATGVFGNSNSVSSPAPISFGSNTTAGAGSFSEAPAAGVVTGFGGKSAPPPAFQPVL
jgi:hypothetical protein